MKSWHWAWKAVLLLAFSLIVRLLFGLFPQTAEVIYFKGVFQVWRVVFDYTLGFLGDVLFYFFFGGLFLLAIFHVVQLVKSEGNAKQKIGRAARGLLGAMSILLATFLWLWGMNYARPLIEDQLTLDVQPFSVDSLAAYTNEVTQRTIAARNQILELDTFALDATYLPADLETVMRKHLEAVLQDLDYPTYGRVRGVKVYPKGVLLRISTAGVYLPWVSVGHVDAGLHPLQQPFTIAHEMAHGYGFTQEGDCNFLAWLACQRSDDPVVRYSGELGLWRYVASSYKRTQALDEYAAWRRDALSVGMRRDMTAIYAEMDRYPDIMPRARDAAYDTYLRTQGVSEGLLSYGRVVMLAYAWENKRTQ